MVCAVKLGDKEWFDKEQIGTYYGTISRDQFANLNHKELFGVKEQF